MSVEEKTGAALDATALNRKELFLRACRCERVERAPVKIKRQLSFSELHFPRIGY